MCCRNWLLICALGGLVGIANETIAAAQQKEPSALRVMTFNIRYANPADGENGWSHRRDAVAQIIRQSADIAGLQEVLYTQLKDLNERLGEEFAWYGVGRDDGQQGGEFSPILYRSDRFEQLEAGTFWLSQTPSQPGSQGWDAALPRVCSWVRLRDRQNDRQLYVFNTHFDHRGEVAREQSAGLIRQRVAQIARTTPAVLTGDFNCRVDSAPFAALTGGDDVQTPPLLDAINVSRQPHAGPDSTWNGFQQIQPGRRIDFVFVQPAARVLSHTILEARIGEDRFASDHLPVVIHWGW